MVSPPKPWELAGTATGASTVLSGSSVTMSNASSVTALGGNTNANGTANGTAISGTPAVPPRPATLTGTSYGSPYGSSPYGNGGYNRFGSSYMSPYGYGSGMYGGYGGGMYGGMGGYGGYGYGMGGPMGGVMPGMDPNNPSLSQSLEASTAQTFAVLQSIVQTFAGFSQMLESTFMATHSSFFAMVGVAEQLGNLRNALGTVLGLFGLVRWLKETISGERRAYGGLGAEFKDFMSRPQGAAGANGTGKQPATRPSRKPAIIFLLAMFGIPYLMHRLIKSLQARLPPPPNPLDPKNLQFAQAIHTFNTSEAPELALQKGDIIAILQTQDPVTGLESPWWRGRNRAGKEGWFPMGFVEIVKRPGQDVKVEPQSVVMPPKSIKNVD